ncbi:replication protein [Salmonella enterica subsp. enterica serovar Enteritidis]|nr:replication protein [Salmonella enterica subsp. enterica serovar Enteritidis]EBX4938681.1 replication protein [Salmonella enterica subsp. enterica serovar Enteritidis]EBY4635203.1 replication protein [Salmonella enterica subsp. enterica serovar Enteritidis]ECA6382786.1 replication protein [Salmonella enterica subsp. enterica serovar Enteritidis]
MRDYGKVHTSFWISDGMRQVSDDARLLALYLLTGQHTNMIGCFRLPDGYVSEDLGWPFERVSKGFDELSRNGFVSRDSTSKWVLIRNFMTWNSIENPNQGISALRLFSQVPDNTSLKPELARILAGAIDHIDPEKLKGSERVIKPFLNQEQEQEQEQDQEEKDLSGAEEDPPQTDEPVFISLPLSGGKVFFDVPESYLREQAVLYPAVDIEQEFRNMRGWLDSNPERRKTGRGIRRFITTWLQRCQDTPKSPRPSQRDINAPSQPDNSIPFGFRG